jgi:subtilisin family serine protease
MPLRHLIAPRACGLIALAASVLLLGGSAVSAPPARQSVAVAPAAAALPSTIGVRADGAADLDGIAAYAVSKGYTVIQRFDDGLPSLQLSPPPGVGSDRAFADFGGFPGVSYVEPAYPVRRLDIPLEPLWTKEAPYLTLEHAPQAWDVEKGTPNIIVAVVDTGVDITHPDLQGRIWTNPREVAGNGIDDDQDGCIDDVHGCAYVSDPATGCAPALNGAIGDDLGHGTFVSGIIGAGGNGQGMVGVARGVTLMPVKVLDCQGGGNVVEVAAGIVYAAREGAKVINVSLGGAVDSEFLREAVRIAQEQYGVLIVAASGNTGGEGVSYPARYPGVLAVGAASALDPSKRASFSTVGPEIGVVAIGEDILGTVPKSLCNVFLPCINGTPYAVGKGTSFAAPQVAGLAALILSEHPDAKPAAVVSAIESTAVPLPPGDHSDWAGHGRIDMAAAVSAPIGFRIGVPGVTKN